MTCVWRKCGGPWPRFRQKQRAAVLMHKFAGMDYSDIARAFACSESAVKSLMFRAHEALREALAHLNAA